MKTISGLTKNPYSTKATWYKEAYYNAHKEGLKATKKRLDIENEIATEAFEKRLLSGTGPVCTALGSYSLGKGYLPGAVSGGLGALISYCPRKTFAEIAQKCYDMPKKIISKLVSSKIN